MSTDKLRTAAIKLEVAAGALNAVAARVASSQASVVEFEQAVDNHEYAREEFRSWIADVTGQPATLIERWLFL